MQEDGIVAVITAAGRSVRLAPISDVIPKAFLPLSVNRVGRAETPIARLLRQLASSGVEHVVVVGSSHDWFRLLEASGGRLQVLEAPPLGEWHAVKTAVDSLITSCGRIIVVSCDNVFAEDELACFVRRAVAVEVNLVGVYPVRSSDDLCLVHIDDRTGRVLELHEKPSVSQSGLAKVGLYMFLGESMRSLVATPPARDRFGEVSLTEALRTLIAREQPLHAYFLSHGFVDIGTPAGLAEAVNRLSLGRRSN